MVIWLGYVTFVVFWSGQVCRGQAVNFTLHGNHLLQHILEDAEKIKVTAEQIYDHGCWCSALRITDDKSRKSAKPKRGHPLDPVDDICRSYSQCMRCVNLEASCEASTKHYFVINKKKTPWNCNFPQTDFCARERCDCDLNAAVAIRNFLRKNLKWVPEANVAASVCKAPTDAQKLQTASSSSPSATRKRDKNRCCKVGGVWEPYNNSTHSCDYENNRIVAGAHDFGARKVSVASNPNIDLGLLQLYNSGSNLDRTLIDEPNPFETQGARPPSSPVGQDLKMKKEDLFASLFARETPPNEIGFEDQIPRPMK